MVCGEAEEKYKGMVSGILEKQGRLDEATAAYVEAIQQVAQAKASANQPAGLDVDIAAKTEMAR